MDTSPEEAYDVVVLGTGVAGLAAAIAAAEAGASVGLLEKDDLVGGTSAYSGGMVWIPDNHLMRAEGIEDSEEAALTYLASMSHGMIDPEMARTFVTRAPGIVQWLDENTEVAFHIVAGMPDYHPERPGGCTTGGRSLECDLYGFEALGEWKDRIALGAQNFHPYYMMSETPIGSPMPVQLSAEELDRRREGNLRGVGQSLVGRMLRACLDRGVLPVTGTAGRRLVVEDGAVVGVEVEDADGIRVVRARGGVVLATGGFDHDPELIRSFLRGPLTRVVSPPTNTGDGLKMAMRVGAALGNMREAWWVPIVDVPHETGGTYSFLVSADRAKPHSIMVNSAGRRFTNEAANYNSAGAAFHVIDPHRFEYVNLPAWMVMDSDFLAKYGFAKNPPGSDFGWLTSADTLEELAERIGVSPGGLAETVEHYNKNCAAGHDPDFGRGSSKHDTWWGDPAYKGTPAATLGPVARGPFYAIEVHPGALGTRGGPKTDEVGAVLGVDGERLRGLYAAGNAMASPLGMAYGGGGGTLAVGIVFGFLAGADAAAAAR